MKISHIRNHAMAEHINDVLMVSSFALWAMVLGVVPLLTWRLLMG